MAESKDPVCGSPSRRCSAVTASLVPLPKTPSARTSIPASASPNWTSRMSCPLSMGLCSSRCRSSQTFLAPVEMEGLTPLEGRRHEGGRRLLPPPATARCGRSRSAGWAVAIVAAGCLKLREHPPGGARLGLGAPRIALQHLGESVLERRELQLTAGRRYLGGCTSARSHLTIARQNRHARDLALAISSRLLSRRIQPIWTMVITPAHPARSGFPGRIG